MLRLLNSIRDTKEKGFLFLLYPWRNCDCPRRGRAFPSLVPVFLCPEREKVIEGSSVFAVCMFFFALQRVETCS